MSFTPRMHEETGGICCSNETALCDKCKAHATRHAKNENTMSNKSDRILQAVDEVMGTNFRAAAGKRHSQADQDLLDAAATHVQAAATHLTTVGAVPADIDEEDPEEGSPKLTTNSFKDRHAAEMNGYFHGLRKETRAFRAQAAAHVPEIRTLETLAEVPDPYAPARMRSAERAEAIDDVLNDPKYHEPYGRPVSGYAVALVARQVEKDIVRGDR